MITDNIISEAKKRLIEIYNPIAIYIFGSYAWGTPDPESDLDIMVIVPALTKDRHRALVEGYSALMDLDIPKDILLYTKEEFDKDSDNKVTLMYKVKRKGKQIYARA